MRNIIGRTYYDKVALIVVNDISLNNISDIKINDAGAIDIENCDWYNDEVVFDSKIGFISMKTLSQLPVSLPMNCVPPKTE